MKKLFTKSLIAVGVAGLMGLTSVAMAAEVDVYGTIRAGVTSADDGKGVASGADKSKKVDIGKNTFSRIGIKASTDLGNDQSAGAVVEINLDADTTIRRRNVWIQGGWGKLTIGKQNGIYRSAANWDQSSYLGGNVRYGDDVDAAEGITYATNLAGPFSFDLELVGEDSVNQWAATAHYDFGLATINIGHHQNNAKTVFGKTVTTSKFYTFATAPTGTGTATGTLTTRVGTSLADDDDIEVAEEQTTDILTLANSLNSETTVHTQHAPSFNNSVISVNGSSAGFDWYLAYEQSKLNPSAGLSGAKATTIGAFASYNIGENDKIYAEYEAGKGKGQIASQKTTAFLIGYSHNLGDGISFAGEYVTVDKNAVNANNAFWLANRVKAKTLALVLKYDF